MHKNTAWLLFLAFLAISTTYFTATAVHALYDYYLQTHTIQPLKIEWSYQEVGTDAYAPFATFTFPVDGTIVEGNTLLSQPLFRNEFAADEVLKELKEQPWKVWYSPSHPEHATIEKRFPIKESLSAVAVLGLFFYFVFLGFYVRRRFGGL